VWVKLWAVTVKQDQIRARDYKYT